MTVSDWTGEKRNSYRACTGRAQHSSTFIRPKKILVGEGGETHLHRHCILWVPLCVGGWSM